MPSRRRVISSNESDQLCFCDDAGPEGKGIEREAWINAVRTTPELHFYELCDALNVGRRCTACLLDAEALFDEVAGFRPSDPTPARTAPVQKFTGPQPRQHSGTWRTRMYAKIDSILPPISTTHVLCVPMILGNGLRTVLTLSNCFPTNIGQRSAPYRYKVTTWDAQGNLRRRRSVNIPSGAREDIDICDDLDQPTEGTFEIGSCSIEMTPVGPGTCGSTRPHFKIIGQGGISAVHAQSKSGRQLFQMLPEQTDYEHHFAHLINLDSGPTNYLVRASDPLGGGATSEVSGQLPPRGSVMVEIPEMPSNGLYLAELEGQGRWRCHYLIADKNFSRMSADHA